MSRISKFRPREVTRRRRRLYTSRAVLYFSAGLALLVSLVLISHMEALSIATVSVVGEAAVGEGEMRELIARELHGTYYKLFSKRNALIFPKRTIQKKLLAAFPALREAEVYLDRPTAISVYVAERKPYGIWCGNSEATLCFFIDDGGFAFAPAPDITGSVFMRFYSEDELFSSATYMPERFAELALFLERLGEVKLRPVTVRTADGDVRVRTDSGVEILVLEDQDFDAAFVTLISLFDKETLQKDLRAAELIDLRFENKVFYRPEPA
ncbi:MAG: hypothetical protein Q7S15_01740 [bacterium]|nr:hypothetical protein [bacterium]